MTALTCRIVASMTYLCMGARGAAATVAGEEHIHVYTMKNNHGDRSRWCANVIIADAGYIDSVAFNLTVNFERIIGRRISKADMALWIDCVALDGGLRPGDNETSVILIYDKDKPALECFTPGGLDSELNGKAFRDNLGEFAMTALPVETAIVGKDDFMEDVLMTAVNHADVRRVMLIADEESMFERARHALRQTPEGKSVTVFTMQPRAGGNFRQEMLGYSLMEALGIKADEIK